MSEEKKWQKWEGEGEPEGKGGLSSATASQLSEVDGRTRQLVAVCYKCGTQTYVGVDWKWFTCWKCGGTVTEMIA
ncbi:MAG TPA: hypothetical protein VK581_09350 [Chthoniobacterales bacterium]|nr:hypothetical protein [Chthoniobacterales bacterium]